MEECPRPLEVARTDLHHSRERRCDNMGLTMRWRGEAATWHVEASPCDGKAKRQHGTWRPHHAKERRSDNMARGGLDEFELKSLGKHGRDGVDTDGKPAATRVIVRLNPKP